MKQKVIRVMLCIGLMFTVVYNSCTESVANNYIQESALSRATTSTASTEKMSYNGYTEGDTWDFSHKTSAQEWVSPLRGKYKFELQGASGGGCIQYLLPSSGISNGTKVVSTTQLGSGQKFYIYIGGEGGTGKRNVKASGGWNGGGNGYTFSDSYTFAEIWDGWNKTSSTWASTGGGGGATDIRLVDGAWNNTESLKSRVLVAGGGSGRSCSPYLGIVKPGQDATVGGHTTAIYTASANTGKRLGQGNHGADMGNYTQYTYYKDYLQSYNIRYRLSGGGGGGYYGGHTNYYDISGQAFCGTSYKDDNIFKTWTKTMSTATKGFGGDGKVKITLVEIEKYTITYEGNGNTSGNTSADMVYIEDNTYIKENGYVKEGYTFTEWNTKLDGSGLAYKPNDLYDLKENLTLYAQWKPIEYDIRYNGQNNWNTEQNSYLQHIKYADVPFELLENRFNRDIHRNYDSYTFVGWSFSENSWDVEYLDKQEITENLTNIADDIIDLYAVWEKEVTLTFDLNGGTYKNKSDDIILKSKIYNSKYGYTFNIIGGNTDEIEGLQTKQEGNLDVYGTYDSDGINNLYKKTDISGVEYRLIGWSLDKNATEPDTDLIVYDTSHKEEYTISNSSTLYAVWEPVLSVSVHLKRSLGDLTFSDGTFPISSVTNLTSSRQAHLLMTIIKPGEQGYYGIHTLNKNIDTRVVFDNKITDIYTHSGIWNDSLNPSTAEDLIAGQGHGLNRHFVINDNYTLRKFYIPQYLGTSNSYESSIDVKLYSMLIYMSQDSFYYRYLYNKTEDIEVSCLIQITDSLTPGKPILSVLDDLRAKVKIRIRQS